MVKVLLIIFAMVHCDNAWYHRQWNNVNNHINRRGNVASNVASQECQLMRQLLTNRYNNGEGTKLFASANLYYSHCETNRKRNPRLRKFILSRKRHF